MLGQMRMSLLSPGIAKWMLSCLTSRGAVQQSFRLKKTFFFPWVVFSTQVIILWIRKKTMIQKMTVVEQLKILTSYSCISSLRKTHKHVRLCAACTTTLTKLHIPFRAFTPKKQNKKTCARLYQGFICTDPKSVACSHFFCCKKFSLSFTHTLRSANIPNTYWDSHDLLS